MDWFRVRAIVLEMHLSINKLIHVDKYIHGIEEQSLYLDLKVEAHYSLKYLTHVFCNNLKPIIPNIKI